MGNSLDDQFNLHLKTLALELEKEKETERLEFKREWLDLPLLERKRKGITIHPVYFEDIFASIGGKVKVKFRFPRCVHSFSSGQLIRLFRDEESCEGVLSSIGKEEMEIILEEMPEWAEEGKPGIDQVFQETTYKEMEKAIPHVNRHGSDNKNYSRKILAGFVDGIHLLTIQNDQTSEISKDLNESQKKAVLGILQTDDVALVHGPPGTGKTTVLVEAMGILSSREEKILMCAPTNTACDLVAEKLSERGVSVLRLGHPARVSENLHQLTLDGMLENHSESKLLKKYRKEANDALKNARKFKRQFGAKERAERQASWQEYRSILGSIRQIEDGLTDQILSRSDVIVTTLVGASSRLIRNIDFNIVILDEATQALEGAAWIPLLRASRLILAGDHKQLPPVVKSESDFLKYTLFERAIDFHTDNLTGRTFFLDTQYRMEPTIMGFSNGEFYNNRLIAANSILNRNDTIPEPFLLPVVFIDTAGSDCEEQEDEATESLKNTGEADSILKLVEKIQPFLLENGFDLGVMATYRAQADLLQDLMDQCESCKPVKIDTNTVDSFQGGERDVVIISLVRSNDNNDIGFLSDLRRMNVALTRARRMLVVVGNSGTISGHPFYERFLSYVESTGEMRSIWDPDLEMMD